MVARLREGAGPFPLARDPLKKGKNPRASKRGDRNLPANV